MGKTIGNVLTGVASLAVSGPSYGAGSKAEWSDEYSTEGTYSVKLSKPASGNYGSTHVQIDMTALGATKTCAELTGLAARWGWDYIRSVTPGVAWWIGMEMRFEDPNSNSFIDITSAAEVIAGALGGWTSVTLGAGNHLNAYYGGWSELDGSFSDYAPQVFGGIVSAAAGAGCPQQNAVTALTTWVLTRVRLELWETASARSVWVDNIYIDGILQNLEPGDTGTGGITFADDPGTLVEVGYTEDGVDFTYTVDENDIEVEEETFPIDRVITKETLEITCNMAEASLVNMNIAMAGGLLSGSILKLGAGTNKKLGLVLTGTNPAGYLRQISIPSCTATGAVGMPYKKGEKTVVPVTFQALKTAGNPAVTIVDNAA